MKLSTEKVAAALRVSAWALSRELRSRGIAFEWVRNSRGQEIEIADDAVESDSQLSTLVPRVRPVARPVERRRVLALSAAQAKAISLIGIPHRRLDGGAVEVDAAVLDCPTGSCCERQLDRLSRRLIDCEPLATGTIRERRGRREQLRRLAALSLSRKSQSVTSIRAKLRGRPVAKSWRPVGAGAATFPIRGEITPSLSRSFLGWLDSLLPGSAIHVDLDSEGGDVFPAFSIYDAVRAWQGPTSCLIRNAFSAASYIALAFDDRAIGENGFCLVHGSHLEESELGASETTMLDKIDSRMTSIYQRHLNLSNAEIESAMEGELVLTATESVAAGFANRVLVA